MEREKIEILKNSLGNYFKSNDELLFKCPKCQHDKRKLSVNVEKNVFKCWVCGYSGTNISNLLKRYASYSEYSKWSELSDVVNISKFDNLFGVEEEVEQESFLELPPEFETLTGQSKQISSRPAINYLRNRGIDDKDILKWKIGFCKTGEYEKRICIPSFNEDGELNYFVGRTYAGDFPKYKNPPASKDIIFNSLNIDWDEPIVLVEGVFDAIKAKNAIPLLGSNLSEKSKLFQKIVQENCTVYMALDQDAQSKENKMIKSLLDHDIQIYKINIDPYSDVGEMSKEEFQNRYKDASIMESLDYLYQCLKF